MLLKRCSASVGFSLTSCLTSTLLFILVIRNPVPIGALLCWEWLVAPWMAALTSLLMEQTAGAGGQVRRMGWEPSVVVLPWTLVAKLGSKGVIEPWNHRTLPTSESSQCLKLSGLQIPFLFYVGWLQRVLLEQKDAFSVPWLFALQTLSTGKLAGHWQGCCFRKAHQGLCPDFWQQIVNAVFRLS